MKVHLAAIAAAALMLISARAALAQSVGGAGSLGGAGGPGLGGGEIRGNTGPGMLGPRTPGGASGMSTTNPPTGAGATGVLNGASNPTGQNSGPPNGLATAPALPDIDTGCGINHGFGASSTGGLKSIGGGC